MNDRPASGDKGEALFDHPVWSLWQKHAGKLFLLGLLIGAGALFMATADMVKLAMTTQPECVVHAKPGAGDEVASAAKSSC